jgi:DNA-binding IclR family transcriptional regulator
METHDTYGIRAVERAFVVLRVLAEAAGPRSLPSIAAAAGLSVTTTYRLLRTLEAEGVVQAHDAGYALGLRVLELADALSRQLDLATVTRSLLVGLRDELDETCGIGARVGDAWVTVSCVESTKPVRRVMRVGERHALATTATGRVFLAHDDDAEVAAYIARSPADVFDESIGGPDPLWAAIHEIRRRGFAWVDNARNTGGWGLRYPLYRHDGRIVAVLSLACPRDRFTDAFRDRCLEVAKPVAEQMSRALGYSGAPLCLPAGPDPVAPARVGAPASPHIPHRRHDLHDADTAIA